MTSYFWWNLTPRVPDHALESGHERREHEDPISLGHDPSTRLLGTCKKSAGVGVRNVLRAFHDLELSKEDKLQRSRAIDNTSTTKCPWPHENHTKKNTSERGAKRKETRMKGEQRRCGENRPHLSKGLRVHSRVCSHMCTMLTT